MIVEIPGALDARELAQSCQLAMQAEWGDGNTNSRRQSAFAR